MERPADGVAGRSLSARCADGRYRSIDVAVRMGATGAAWTRRWGMAVERCGALAAGSAATAATVARAVASAISLSMAAAAALALAARAVGIGKSTTPSAGGLTTFEPDLCQS